MTIPSDYVDGTFFQIDGSRNSVSTFYITNSDRLCVVNAPASLATGSAIVRNAYLTTSTSDVYYGDTSPVQDSIFGILDAPLEEPKQNGFTIDGGLPLVVYSGKNGVYRMYSSFGANGASIFRRDVRTVRTYTGISGRFKSPRSQGEGTVASENKIYLNNEGSPPNFIPTDSWNDTTHNPNTPNGLLDETSNYTIKKRSCFSIAEYITDDGKKYAPEGLVRTFVPPNLPGLPKKVVDAGTNALLWICSKPLNKISLTVSTNFTDSDGVLRVKGEVLIENTVGNKNKYSPVSLSEDVAYLSSDTVEFSPVEWVCFYVGCTDGYVRFVCWDIVPSISIVKDDKNCLWVAYGAQTT